MTALLTLVDGWGMNLSLSELQELSEDEIAHLYNERNEMLDRAFKR